MDRERDEPEQLGTYSNLCLYLFYLSHLVYLLYLIYVQISVYKCSKIKDDQPQGYAAFDWESIMHGNAGKLGEYKELAVLSNTIARYLYEFHADSYASHSLPPLPD